MRLVKCQKKIIKDTLMLFKKPLKSTGSKILYLKWETNHHTKTTKLMSIWNISFHSFPKDPFISTRRVPMDLILESLSPYENRILTYLDPTITLKDYLSGKFYINSFYSRGDFYNFVRDVFTQYYDTVEEMTRGEYERYTAENQSYFERSSVI